ncbi:MAG TPA: response regulator transcription factor [Thermoanaerobaculia bacterium]|nr:response regulator transcription factor [Thermoanaerobaculia bacterium]
MSFSGERVFVVDDDPGVRKSLARLLRSAGLEPIAFESPQEFLRTLGAEPAGCAILDVTMPGLDGLTLQRELTSRGSELPVIFLTGHGDVPKSVQAMKGGAKDFLTKPVDDEVLLDAVRRALEVDRAGRESRRERTEIQKRLAALTPREREVMEGVVAGRLNKQIASDLGISEKTVKVHRGRVMEKMAASSVAELVRMADRAALRRP